MKNKLFLILQGNNGATYIANTKSWEAISCSLKFHTALTVKSKILKKGLHCLLFLKGIFGAGKLKSCIEIDQYLQNSLKSNYEFSIDENCSVLISPTKDKVIVHHHHQYFQKFAFGKSYANVKNEAVIYGLFNDDIKNFQVSKFFDSYDDSANFCFFKLSNAYIKSTKIKTTDVVPALVEFFKLGSGKYCSVNTYINELLIKIEMLGKDQMTVQIQVLNELKNKYGKMEFPLGLVHRDFKPWNILNFEKPLLFDFEETIVDGLPLEDVFNFYIDPIIRYKTAKEVTERTLNNEHLLKYKNYLKGLDISINFNLFLHIYLIERMVFWIKGNEIETSNKYLNLSNYLIKTSKLS